MKNSDLKKYFDKRPEVDELYLVGKCVFVEKPIADKYAGQVNGTVETKLRDELTDDEDTEEEIDQVTAAEETTEPTNDVVEETEKVPETKETPEATNEIAEDPEEEELTKERAIANLLEMDLDADCDYYELQEMVNILELPTNGKSKTAYLTALNNKKAELANV